MKTLYGFILFLLWFCQLNIVEASLPQQVINKTVDYENRACEVNTSNEKVVISYKYSDESFIYCQDVTSNDLSKNDLKGVSGKKRKLYIINVKNNQPFSLITRPIQTSSANPKNYLPLTSFDFLILNDYPKYSPKFKAKRVEDFLGIVIKEHLNNNNSKNEYAQIICNSATKMCGFNFLAPLPLFEAFTLSAEIANDVVENSREKTNLSDTSTTQSQPERGASKIEYVPKENHQALVNEINDSEETNLLVLNDFEEGVFFALIAILSLLVLVLILLVLRTKKEQNIVSQEEIDDIKRILYEIKDASITRSSSF